jgi:hypothetical protein
LIEDAYRRKVPVRRIAADLAASGHTISPATVHKHATRCLVPADDFDTTDPLLMAVVVRNALNGWHFLADKVAVGLAEVGATEAAAIVQSVVYDSAKTALDTIPRDGMAGWFMEAEALAFAVRQLVLEPGGQDLARRLAAAIRDHGADALADAYIEVADGGTQDDPAADGSNVIFLRQAPLPGPLTTGDPHGD